MKRIALFVGLGVCLLSPAVLVAQSEAAAYGSHAEFGVYGDYLRFSPNGSDINFVGVGGRAGLGVNSWMSLEGEMNYDFARNYTYTSTTGTTSTTTTTFARTSLRPLTGLFGPKFDFGRGSADLFVTGKLGFINFSESNPTVVSGSTFTGAVNSVGGPGTHLAFYPGGGFEGFIGPIGLRAEVGDEFYLDNGTYSNLRVTFGPTIRF